MSSSTTRLAKLREAMAAERIDALWLRDVSNIAWVCAFDGVFDDEPAHTLLVTADQAALSTDSRYAEALESAAEGAEIEVDATTGDANAFALERLRRWFSIDAEGSEADVGLPPVTLAIEDSMTLSAYRRFERARESAAAVPGLTLRETHDFGLALRAVKDADEIEKLKAAQAITDAAFERIVDRIAVGMTEREVKRELEDTMLALGADGVAFPSIVATGPNAAKPHCIPGETRLEEGHCVVLDFGAVVDGYHADMTRTISIGMPREEITRAYGALYEANESVEERLRPGMTGREAHELALSILSAAGFEGRMGHALGHGVGLQIHELPTLSPRNDTPLEPGNVVTVEPGIYIPGAFGMRLEDFGVITEDGFERFTQSPHTMVIL